MQYVPFFSAGAGADTDVNSAMDVTYLSGYSTMISMILFSSMVESFYETFLWYERNSPLSNILNHIF